MSHRYIHFKSRRVTENESRSNADVFFGHVSMQMFIIDKVDGDNVSLGQFDISGSKYTPEGEV